MNPEIDPLVEADEEIERLRAEVDRLRAALGDILVEIGGVCGCATVAREILAKAGIDVTVADAPNAND